MIIVHSLSNVLVVYCVFSVNSSSDVSVLYSSDISVLYVTLFCREIFLDIFPEVFLMR